VLAGAALCLTVRERPVPVAAQGAPRFAILDLGTLGGTTSRASAISRDGQVVGFAHTPDERRHAVLWRRGQIVDLGLPANGASSAASGVNSAGQVVGTVTLDRAGFLPLSDERAFLWQDGILTHLWPMASGPDEFDGYISNARGPNVDPAV
jgi:probable HAF family extracellular repeat protein